MGDVLSFSCGGESRIENDLSPSEIKSFEHSEDMPRGVISRSLFKAIRLSSIFVNR